MGQKIRGGMYCGRCGPVAAVKNTHRIRNTLGVGGIGSTAGLSLLFTKVEPYVCPHCGGPVVPLRAVRVPEPEPPATGTVEAATRGVAPTADGRTRYKVRCPNCAAYLIAPAGDRITCPKCPATMRVAEQGNSVTVQLRGE